MLMLRFQVYVDVAYSKATQTGLLIGMCGKPKLRFQVHVDVAYSKATQTGLLIGMCGKPKFGSDSVFKN